VTTAQIYKGSIAFIILQLIMVAAVIAFPGLVLEDESKKAQGLDATQVLDQLDMQRDNMPNPNEKPADYDPMAIFQQEAASAPGK